MSETAIIIIIAVLLLLISIPVLYVEVYERDRFVELPDVTYQILNNTTFATSIERTDTIKGNATYTLQYSTDADFSTVKTKTSPDPYIVVKGLTAESIIYARTFVTIGRSQSKFTPTVKIDLSNVLTPTLTSLKVLTDTSVQVTFQPVQADDTVFYTALVGETQFTDNSMGLPSKNESTSPIVLTGLAPNTLSYYRVFRVNSDFVAGPFSNIKSIKTTT
jgi:hypothetical protein